MATLRVPARRVFIPVGIILARKVSSAEAKLSATNAKAFRVIEVKVPIFFSLVRQDDKSVREGMQEKEDQAIDF